MPPKAAAIVESVGREHGLLVDELLERRSFRELTAARRDCAKRLRLELDYSPARIGRVLKMGEAAIKYYLRS